MFTVLVKPSEAGGEGEERFGGRKEQSCRVPYSWEWHLQTQESAVPVLCVSAPAPSLCTRQNKH